MTTASRPRKAATAPKNIPVVSGVSSASEVPIESLLEPSKVLIHFVSDGFCAFGTSWATGQELEVEKPSEEYDRTCDVEGNSWLLMSEEDQVDRWGQVKFKSGPSTVPNSVINYRVISADGVDMAGRPLYQGYMAKQEREKAAEAEKARGRKVPKL